MDNQIKKWVQNEALEEWDKVREPGDPFIPVVVSPLGVEPSKPRALWDGRYVNEFCRDIPFSMDNASKIAEVAWEGVYFFKIDHKNGSLHVCANPQEFKKIFWNFLERYLLRVCSSAFWMEE